jgi:hypothetical protein
MSPCAQSRDDTAIWRRSRQTRHDGQPCAASRLSELQVAVSLFDRGAVSPSRPGFVGTSRAVAVKTGPSDARATAEGGREAVLTAVSTTSASARSGRGCLRPEPRQHRGVVPGPSTADPAPRDCSAVAAAQRALAAAAPGRAACRAFTCSSTAASCLLSTIAPGFTVWILSKTLKPSAVSHRGQPHPRAQLE